jgi:hypothetical protein
MPSRCPGLGACPPIENRGDCAQETCAITPECAVAAGSGTETASAGSEDAIPAAAGPDRSPDYLAWIRTLGCAVCKKVTGGTTTVEAAHTNAVSPRGMGQKSPDFSAHLEPESVGRGYDSRLWGIDRELGHQAGMVASATKASRSGESSCRTSAPNVSM